MDVVAKVQAGKIKAQAGPVKTELQKIEEDLEKISELNISQEDMSDHTSKVSSNLRATRDERFMQSTQRDKTSNKSALIEKTTAQTRF